MAKPRQLRLPVPVTVVTGALASGKTTVIAGLLAARPAGEVWAVLVNEFGAAGLDMALLEGGQPSTAAAAAPADDGSVHIRQLAGGCLCCALSNMTSLAIAQLLRAVKPDRLIIEPSGLAHPAVLLDMLRGEHLGRSLAIQPVACLVDATQFGGGDDGGGDAEEAPPALLAVSQLLLDQISVADVLVGSKADLAGEPALASFHRWAAGLFPPKQLVATAANGQLEAAALTVLLGGSSGAAAGSGCGGSSQAGPGLPVARPRPGDGSSAAWLSSRPKEPAEEEEATPERPLRLPVRGADGLHAACGWVFHRDCLFARPRLEALLPPLAARAVRLKGVFRAGPATWVSVSTAAIAAPPGGAAVPPAVELRPIAYRRDSRVEVILSTPSSSRSGASVEQQAASLSLEPAASDASIEARVAAALAAAAGGGDWGALEALLLQTLQGES